MNKLIALSVGALIIISCGIKTFYLKDKITRVPENSEVYSNRSKFDNSIYFSIDTNVVYEEFNVEYNILSRLDIDARRSVYGIYKFYPNGNFNYFVVRRDEAFVPDILNPEINGFRGVYYMDKGKIMGDLFAPADELRNIGKLDRIFTVSGDSLFVERKFGYVDIYIKRKLPPEYFVYKANW